MEIYDFSNIFNYEMLPATVNNYDRKLIWKFNPSIVKITNDYYLLSYRALVPEEQFWQETSGVYLPSWKGSPWTMWNHSLYDGTGLALLKKDSKYLFKVIYDHIDLESDTYQDMRLYTDSNKKIIFTSNIINYKSDKNTKIGYAVKIVKGEIDYNIQNGNYKYKYVSYVCNKLQKDIEKNWTLIPDTNKILYHVDPYRVIDYNKCDVLYDDNSIFTKIKRLYGGYILFSSSTPVIDWTNNTYLTVGHLKIDYKNIKNAKTNGGLFIQEIQKLFNLPKDRKKWKLSMGYLHHKYIYMIFFIEINKSDLSLHKYSHALIPMVENASTTLIFPSGLTTINNDVLLTYGDSDVSVKMLKCSKSLVNKMLIENISKPEDYQFNILWINSPILCKSINQKCLSIAIIRHVEFMDYMEIDTKNRPWLKKMDKKYIKRGNKTTFFESLKLYIEQKYPNVSVYVVPNERASPSFLKQFDFVLTQNWDPTQIYSFRKHDWEIKNQLEIYELQNIYPPKKFYDIFDKKDIYYKFLRDHDLPILPTTSLCRKDYKNKTSFYNKINNFAKQYNLSKLIFKPSTGTESFGVLIVHVNEVQNKKRYFNDLFSQHDCVIIQKPLENFVEVKTWWHDMQYLQSIDILSDRNAIRTGIPDNIRNICIKLLKLIKKVYSPLPMWYNRLDLFQTSDDQIYVNEIESGFHLYLGDYIEENRTPPLYEKMLGPELVKLAEIYRKKYKN